MKPSGDERRGFALVLTLGLLALLVLAIVALGALARVNARVAAGSSAQMQARQNALLALDVAIGELQRHAGPDSRATGLGGIVASVSGNNHPARYWCGVWNGSEVVWLASGADRGGIPSLGPADLAIVAHGSLGAYASTNENDVVRVVKMPVPGPRADGSLGVGGSYAYWVGDEGTKLSARLAGAETPVAGGMHELSALISGLSPSAPQLSNTVAYEQLGLVPGVSAPNRRAAFHLLTLTHWSVAADDSGWRAGVMNVNSSSLRYWRAVGQTYNRIKPAGSPALNSTSVSPTSFAGRMAARVRGAGPFRSAADFFADTEVKKIVEDHGATWASFKATLESWLAVRSDTFRIRAYGEVLDSAEATTVEAGAFCEAIVQRQVGGLGSSAPSLGRRFVIVQFRWLAAPNAASPLDSDI